jgi:hypothetical protein
MTDLLHPSLRRSPRWIATGAAAGALGCVASAALLFPAVITALPVWAGFGAALAAMLPRPQPASGERLPDGPRASSTQDSLDAALLFAIVLELQGRGESEIARVIDAVFHESDSRELTTALVRAYVDEVRHRFDLVMHRASMGTAS